MSARDHYVANESPSRDTHFDNEEKLRYELAKTVTLTPELYEKLFISPKTNVKGDLRSTFGNPTPVGVLGFSVAVIPLAAAFSTFFTQSLWFRFCLDMLTGSSVGWRGAGGLSVATTTINIWFGGVLLLLAGFGEFLLGNTFPMMVFLGYGAHFLSYATTFIPFFNAVGFFNPDGSGAGSPGTANQTPVFYASYGEYSLHCVYDYLQLIISLAYYLVMMCILSFIFLLGSSRTNGVFFLIFVFATIGFGLGAGAFFSLAKANAVVGTRLATGTGACFFAAGVLGFYFLTALVIAIMELPIPDLPVFDLSTVVKPKSRHVPKDE